MTHPPKLTEKEARVFSELKRIGSIKHSMARGFIAAFRGLKRKGLIELEYDDRGELVWRELGGPLVPEASP